MIGNSRGWTVCVSVSFKQFWVVLDGREREWRGVCVVAAGWAGSLIIKQGESECGSITVWGHVLKSNMSDVLWGVGSVE